MLIEKDAEKHGEEDVDTDEFGRAVYKDSHKMAQASLFIIYDDLQIVDLAQWSMPNKVCHKISFNLSQDLIF